MPENNKGFSKLVSDIYSQSGNKYTPTEQDIQSISEQYKGNYKSFMTDFYKQSGVEHELTDDDFSSISKQYGLNGVPTTEVDAVSGPSRTANLNAGLVAPIPKHAQEKGFIPEQAGRLGKAAKRGWKGMVGSIYSGIESVADKLSKKATGGIYFDEEGKPVAPWDENYDPKDTTPEVSKKVKQWAQDVPEPQPGVAGFIGELIPQTAMYATAIMLRNPALATAAAGTVGAMSLGSGTEAYDRHMEEIGEQPNAGDRMNVGVAYALAEYVPERFALGRLMPKGVTSKVMKKFLGENIENTARVGKEIIEEFAKKQPGKAKKLIAAGLKAPSIEAAQEIATEIGQIATDEFMIGEDVTGKEIAQRIMMAGAGGAAMGGMLAPFSSFSQRNVDKSRRQKQGFVSIAQDESGAVWELTRDADGNTVAFSPSGKTNKDLGEEIWNDAVNLSTESFNTLTEEARKAGNISDEMFREEEHNTIGQRVQRNLNVYGNSADGNLHLWYDKENIDETGQPKEWYVISEDKTGMSVIMDRDGNRDVKATNDLKSAEVYTYDQLHQDAMDRFDQENPIDEIKVPEAPDTVSINGKEHVISETSPEGLWTVAEIDENGTPVGAVRQLTEEEQEAVQSELAVDPVSKPDIRIVNVGATTYKLVPTEDGNYSVDGIVSEKEAGKAAKDIESVLGEKLDVVVFKQDSGDAFTPDAYSVKVSEKVEAPVIEPSYTFGEEQITKEEAEDLIAEAETMEDLSGLTFENDQETQDLLDEKFKAPEPVYKVGKKKITRSQAKAKIRLGKTEGLVIENDEELQTLLQPTDEKLTVTGDILPEEVKKVPEIKGEVVEKEVVEKIEEPPSLQKEKPTPVSEIQKKKPDEKPIEQIEPVEKSISERKDVEEKVEGEAVREGLEEDVVSEEEQLKQAEKDVETKPSEAQKEAGNYKKGHTKFGGFNITIENPVGSTRTGKDASGKKWSQKMANSYGYFKRTLGKDGDQVDLFVGPNNKAKNVYVVDQINPDGTFDEHKIMLGFNSEEAAREAYLANYEEGWTGLGAITEMNKPAFRTWLNVSGKNKRPKRKPVSKLVAIKKAKPAKFTPAEVATRKERKARAVIFEAETMEQAIMQYFLKGNRLKSDDIQNELIGKTRDGKLRSMSEWRSRLWMAKNDAPSIDQLLTKGLVVSGTQFEKKAKESNVFRNAVIQVMRENPTMNDMVESINEYIDQKEIEEDPEAALKKIGEALEEQERAEQQEMDDNYDAEYSYLAENDLFPSIETLNELFIPDEKADKERIQEPDEAIGKREVREDRPERVGDIERVEPQPAKEEVEPEDKGHGSISVGDTVYMEDINDPNNRLPVNFRGWHGDLAIVILDGNQMSMTKDRIFKNDIPKKQPKPPKEVVTPIVNPNQPQIDKATDELKALNTKLKKKQKEIDERHGLFGDKAIGMEELFGEQAFDLIGAAKIVTGLKAEISRKEKEIEDLIKAGETGAKEAEGQDEIRFKSGTLEVTKDELVKSGAFKDWGDNAPYISDDKTEQHEFKTGEPVVVDAYHGGYAPINTFDRDYGGETTADNEFGAFYFSSDREVAEDYSKQSMVRKYQDYPEGLVDDEIISQEEYDKLEEEGVDWYEYVDEWASDPDNQNVVDGFVKFENPLVIDASHEGLRELEKRFNIQETLGFISGKGEAIPDFVFEDMQYDPDEVANYKDEITERAKENHDIEDESELDDWMIDEATTEILEENGIEKEIPEYDGLIIRNVIDDIGEGSAVYQTLFISTTPSNIKSQSNRGAFDRYSEDIRFKVKEATGFELLQQIGQKAKENHEQTKAIAEEYSKKLNTPIIVVRGVNELPQAIKKTITKQDRDNIFGVYHDGQVYLVSETIGPNKKLAQETILHEVVGHKGLRGLLGENFNGVLDLVYKGMPKADQIRYFEDHGSERVAADEYLADMAEMDKNPTLWNKAISKLRELFRKLFPGLSMRNSDVVTLLGKSKMRLEKDTPKIHPEAPIDNQVIRAKKEGQPDQTKTPEFKNWFGDSKVVDENGEPLVVYHGTRADFDKFGTEKTGFANKHRMWYFTNDVEMASTHAGGSKEAFENIGTTGSIMPVFLSIKNPKILDSKSQEDIDVIEDIGYWATDEQLNEFESQGFDGLMLDDMSQIIALKPTQIKSATANLGAFDPANPDIRFKSQQAKQGKKQVTSVGDRVREMLQDNKLALKNWQNDMISEGIKIRDFENAYQKENLYHGKVLTKMDNFTNKEGKQLINAVGKFSKAAGLTVQQTQRYLVAKHGPERNRYFWELDDKNIGKDFSGLEDLKKQIVAEETDPVQQMLMDAMPINEFAEYYTIQVDRKAGQNNTDNLWKAVNKATDFTLKEWKDAGFINKEQYEELKSRYGNYVPLRGWEQTDEFDYSNQVGQYSSPIKRAKGRTSLADDPLSYIMNMANTAVVSGERNRIKKAMGNLVRNNREKISPYVQFKPTYFVRTDDLDADGNFIIYETIDRPDQILFDEGRVSTKVPIDYKARKTPAQAQEFEVDFYENGQKLVLAFEGSDPAVARAVDGKEAVAGIDMFNKAVASSIGRGTRFISSVLTSRNPSFILPNMMRDIPLAIISEFVHGDTKAGATLFNNMRLAEGAIRRDLRGKPDKNNPIDIKYQQFLENGGATGFVHLKSVDSFKRELQRDIKAINNEKNAAILMGKGFRKGIEYIEQLSEWSENISRFGVYLNHIDRGESPEMAATAAKNSTVNFNRKGRLSPTLNGLFAFFNAAIQASDKYFKMWGANWKKMAGVHSVLMVQGFFSAMLMDLFGDEDEEGMRQYDKVSDYVKSNYLVLPIPYSDRIVTIPMPHVLRAFHGMGVKTYDILTNRKKPGEALIEMISGIPQDIMPIDGSGFLNRKGDVSIKPFTPTVLKPLIELQMNENFMSLPITPTPYTPAQADMIADTKLARKNVNSAARRFTDKLYEWGGGDETGYKHIYKDGELKQVPALMDMSPHSIEHLFGSYLGGTGAFFNNLYKTTENVIRSGGKLAEGEEFKEALKEIDLNSVPVFRRFVRQAWGDPLKSAFYDAKRDYERKLTIMKDHYNNITTPERLEKFIEMQKGIGIKLEQYKIYEGIIDDLNDSHQQLLSAGQEDAAKEMDKTRRELMMKIVNLDKKE